MTTNAYLCSVLAVDSVVEGPTSFADIMTAEHKRFITTFTSIYGQLVNEQPVACAVTKEVFPPLPAPRVLIIDVSVRLSPCNLPLHI